MFKYFSLFLVSMFIQDPVNTNPVGSRSKSDILCESENNTFSGGEELTYRIYYNLNFIWLSAGEVKFKVEDLGDMYKFSASGRTYSSYNWFFEANDNFESIVDKSSLKPISFKREIKENKYRYYEKIVFDHLGQQVKSWTGKSEETAMEMSQNMDGCIRDILTMMYAIRVQNFDQYNSRSIIPINVFLDNKKYNLNLIYYGMIADKKIHKIGKYNTYHFSPETIPGSVFKENDRMHIWASTDQNKIPLLIESPVSVGSVKAVLIHSKGLKYPFDSSQK
ncbi:MAG: DUF3108 domain-containing protein [Saprospiraceae bacterium]